MKKLFVLMLVMILAFVWVSPITFGADPVKIRIAGYGGNDQAIMEELINRISPALKSENITLVYEPVADDYQRVITNALSAGTAADVFYVPDQSAFALMQSGTLEPLDSYLAKSKSLSKKDIIPSLLSPYSLNGKVYGITKDFNTLALFYNKDIFDKAGVAYPDDKDTWATLEVKFAKVSNKSKGIFGMAVPPQFERMGAIAFSAGFVPFDKNGKTNLSQPGFKAAVDWWAGLVKKGYGVMPADLGQGWGGGAFSTEKVAACLEGAWIVGFLKDSAPNLQYGTALLPKSPLTGKRGNFIYSVAWSMNRNSANKKASFRVIEALTSIETQQWVLERGLALPSRAVLADNAFFKQNTPAAYANFLVFKGASDGNVFPYIFRNYGGDWRSAIDESLQAIMSGQSATDQGIKDAQGRLNQLMN